MIGGIGAVTRRDALACFTGAVAAGSGRAAQAFVGPRLRRGVSLHGMLNWPDVVRTGSGIDYVWPPFQSAQRQMSEGALKGIRRLGFDFVRLTVDPSIFIASDENRRTTLCDILASRVMQMVGAELSVVVDLHPVAVNPIYAPDNLVAATSGPLFEAYRGVVARVARCLGSLPSRDVVFELMNEPRLMRGTDAPRWQSLLQLLHATARTEAPLLPLVLTGAQWSSRDALLRVDPRPFRGSNVFYTFHYYDPHTFTHQGVRGEQCQYINGLHWPPQRAQEGSVLTATFERIDADLALPVAQKDSVKATSRKLLHDYFATPSAPDIILKDFTGVREWAAQHAIPPDRILLGEFGGGWGIGDESATLAASRAWVRAVVNAAEACRFPWAYWAYDPHFKPELLESLGLNAPTR